MKIAWSVYQTVYPGFEGKVILPDFWWFLRYHHFGRCGHGYACPLSITASLWMARLTGKEAYWSATIPDWLYEDSDLYEPAHPVIINRRGARSVRSLWWFKYTVPIELWLFRQYGRLNYCLHQRYGRSLHRKPLGEGIPSTPAEGRTNDR